MQLAAFLQHHKEGHQHQQIAVAVLLTPPLLAQPGQTAVEGQGTGHQRDQQKKQQQKIPLHRVPAKQ